MTNTTPLLSAGLKAAALSLLLTSAGCANPSDDELRASDDSPNAAFLDEGPNGFGEPFTVMSLNARIPKDSDELDWSKRKIRMNAMIRRFGAGEGPEVLGLQELYADRNINTFRELGELLPQYAPFGIDRGDGEIVAIMVRTSRFEVLDTNYLNTNNQERDDLCSARDRENHANRPIIYVHLRDRITGRQSYVYNTHYPSKNHCERNGMAKIVGAYIAARDVVSDDVILVGDLNDGVNGDGSLNESYQRTLKYTGLRNAYADIHAMDASSEFTSGLTDWNKELRHGKMIDHVLVSGGFGVLDAYVDKTMFTSDGAVVDCPTVVNGLCPNGMVTKDLQVYSDHWSSWAVLSQ